MANHFPFAAESVHAPVTDAEFRTYVLLCALAWQHHPEADPPYVELTYAELAEKHPKPVAVPTLRVRVMTLVKLGYLRREQVNRVHLAHLRHRVWLPCRRQGVGAQKPSAQRRRTRLAASPDHRPA